VKGFILEDINPEGQHVQEKRQWPKLNKTTQPTKIQSQEKESWKGAEQVVTSEEAQQRLAKPEAQS
jgi:hypothetical protein